MKRYEISAGWLGKPWAPIDFARTDQAARRKAGKFIRQGADHVQVCLYEDDQVVTVDQFTKGKGWMALIPLQIMVDSYLNL